MNIATNLNLTAPSAPHIEVIDSALTGQGFARAVVHVTHAGDSRNNPSKILDGLAKKFEYKMLPIRNSWQPIQSDAFSVTLTGVLATNNRETIPYAETNTKFRCVSGNMFIDDEREIWKLQETPAGKILIKTSSYDDDNTLGALLTSVSAAGSEANLGRYVARGQNTFHYAGGDLVAFVSKQDAAVHVGYIAAAAVNETRQGEDLVVLAYNSDVSEIIDPNLVTCKFTETVGVDLNQIEDASMAAIASGKKSVNIEDILNYYRRVYARNQAFFDKFAANVTKYAFA